MSKSAECDPVALTARLVRCASVTPEDAGALAVLESCLQPAAFECIRVNRGGISNLFARWGAKRHSRTFGFNGHTDVVPVGEASAWTHDPFGADIDDGFLWGRGSTDMKSGVAAFAAAAIDFVSNTAPNGAIVLAITGDEEGEATDGTTALLDWMSAKGEAMTACLVGEPTCPEKMGEAMKIGRRGSMSAYFRAEGIQGHSAYPERANNPVPAMAMLVGRLAEHQLDTGTDHFDASTLAVTGFDTGNTANNVIPATCTAMANIRFNDAHTSASLSDWLTSHVERVSQETGVNISMEIKVSGESFLTQPGDLSRLVAQAVEAETGVKPALLTAGGTSDARFVKDHCPVVEFGLVGQTMHQVDERVSVQQIHQLKAVYGRILADFFA